MTASLFRFSRVPIVYVTPFLNSCMPVGQQADDVFLLYSADSYQSTKGMPMGTSFELAMLCFLDALISHRIWKKGIPQSRHKRRSSTVISGCERERSSCWIYRLSRHVVFHAGRINDTESRTRRDHVLECGTGMTREQSMKSGIATLLNSRRSKARRLLIAKALL